MGDQDAKEKFYDGLQELMDTIPKHDITLILGGFKAKVGRNNEHRENIMGKESVGDANENGERLINFCGENGMVIGGTLFQHKKIHKMTWKSPDGRTENQIDHILINNKWRNSLQDVRVKRGADIGSDHYLLVGKIKLKLRKARIGQIRKLHFDTQKLKK